MSAERQVNTELSIEFFQRKNVKELKEILRKKGVNCNHAKGKLVELAFNATKYHIGEAGTSQESEPEYVPETETGEAIPKPSELNLDWSSDLSTTPVVQYDKLYNYLIGSEEDSKNALKSLKGHRYFSEKFISDVQVNPIGINVSVCYVRGKCLPSMKQDPYTVWVLLKKSDGSVHVANCTCPAGCGECCSHVAALLYFLEDYGKKKPSCTSLPCAWKAPRSKICPPAQVSDISFRKTEHHSSRQNITRPYPEHYDPRPIDQRQPDKVRVAELASKLTKLGSTCSFLSVYEGTSTILQQPSPALKPTSKRKLDDSNVQTNTKTSKHDQVPTLPQPVLSKVCARLSIKKVTKSDLESDSISQVSLDIVNNITISSQISDNIEKLTRGQSLNDAWFTHRRGIITASLFHDVKVRKTTTPPDTLVKRILPPQLTIQHKMNPADPRAQGIAMESEIASAYLQIKKINDPDVTMTEAGLRIAVHPETAVIGASVDRIVKESGSTGIAEIKFCTHAKDLHSLADQKSASFPLEWTVANKKELRLKRQHRYYSQIQAQMGITKYTWCDFVLMSNIKSGNNMHIERVYFDHEYYNSMLHKVKSFYKHVLIKLSGDM